MPFFSRKLFAFPSRVVVVWTISDKLKWNHPLACLLKWIHAVARSIVFMHMQLLARLHLCRTCTCSLEWITHLHLLAQMAPFTGLSPLSFKQTLAPACNAPTSPCSCTLEHVIRSLIILSFTFANLELCVCRVDRFGRTLQRQWVSQIMMVVSWPLASSPPRIVVNIATASISISTRPATITTIQLDDPTLSCFC